MEFQSKKNKKHCGRCGEEASTMTRDVRTCGEREYTVQRRCLLIAPHRRVARRRSDGRCVTVCIALTIELSAGRPFLERRWQRNSGRHLHGTCEFDRSTTWSTQLAEVGTHRLVTETWERDHEGAVAVRHQSAQGVSWLGHKTKRVFRLSVRGYSCSTCGRSITVSSVEKGIVQSSGHPFSPATSNTQGQRRDRHGW